VPIRLTLGASVVLAVAHVADFCSICCKRLEERLDRMKLNGNELR